MINHKQSQRLMSEYKKTGKIGVSAMKADVHPQTASKYIGAGKPPAELQAPHTWRTRPDPLEKIWEEAMAMLSALFPVMPVQPVGFAPSPAPHVIAGGLPQPKEWVPAMAEAMSSASGVSDLALPPFRARW